MDNFEGSTYVGNLDHSPFLRLLQMDCTSNRHRIRRDKLVHSVHATRSLNDRSLGRILRITLKKLVHETVRSTRGRRRQNQRLFTSWHAWNRRRERSNGRVTLARAICRKCHASHGMKIRVQEVISGLSKQIWKSWVLVLLVSITRYKGGVWIRSSISRKVSICLSVGHG